MMLSNQLAIFRGALSALMACVSLTALAASDFTAGEHANIGDQVTLTFATDKPDHRLNLENGLRLSYGDIMMLGDFYGVPLQPISWGNTWEERKSRFLRAFNQFYVQVDHVQETKDMIQVMREEVRLIEQAKNDGKSLEEVYKRITDDHDRRYNCITGGGCGDYWWLNKGRYLMLAESNYDHFAESAVTVYLTGHELAMAQAVLARQTNRPDLLEKAYALDAFAAHFLTDRFSTGHMRTPRRPLAETVTPSTVGSLLAHYMHEEESSFGLHVKNSRGNQWMAFGDKHYNDPSSAIHRDMIQAAVQRSVDEVYQAYQHQQMTSNVLSFIPAPITVDNESGQDIAPLFYWDGKKHVVMRRKDMTNPYDHHFTSQWWGWSTLAELSEERGLPNHLRAQLAGSSLQDEAVRRGILPSFTRQNRH